MNNFNLAKYINSLPLVTNVYFNDNDGVGDRIITIYNEVRVNIKKLEVTKNFILSILKSSQHDLESIIINDLKPKFKNKLIINFNDDFTTTFNEQNDFNDFILKYCGNNFSIFNNTLTFNDIFQDKYNKKNKTFFLNLLKKYNKIRKNIIQKKVLETNYGILGFDVIFNINDNINFDKITESEIKKIKNNKINIKKDNNIDYSKYILTGDNVINVINENNLESISNEVVTSPSSPSLKNKIHNFNLLYIENHNKEYYLKLHIDRLNKFYNDFMKSLKFILNGSEQYNLYNITINLIELDFNLLKFIFYYINIQIFKNFIDTNIKIKKYIYDNINIFDKYYEDFIEWYNKLVKSEKTNSTSPALDKNDVINFNEIFNNYIRPLLNVPEPRISTRRIGRDSGFGNVKK